MPENACIPPASLVQPLPAGPLDIIGDVHGEWDALQQLLGHLGYDTEGAHPQGRKLVFVGDLCDRGPNTPAVMDWFCNAYAAGHCLAVLGNHEVNLIRDDAKDGAGWYFDSRTERDRTKYAPFVVASPPQRERYARLCNDLPVALERADLRIVHAAWQAAAIEAARQLPLGSARRAYDCFEAQAEQEAHSGTLQRRILQEKTQWPHDVEDGTQTPPLLVAHGERELLKQMTNPLKVLTTGVEAAAQAPFYAGGKWRFTDRQAWWNGYEETTPVVVGHYWRLFTTPQSASSTPSNAPIEAALFAGIPGNHWHGKLRNVFCIDFSVGARWSERLQGITRPAQSRFHLAALRWPEKTLVLDCGDTFETIA
ncbi:metallophosphoesterase [Lampropedia puyangensis]|uniref:Metallophosphoesterase n=1 Tax=Lampropedia puyangensis TaxID=1330072 RepID=A0A4S8FHE8_9BURK|nr:metallophosphoesterase [Lampropedia puyangensis]THU05212.1 metallophosphoesterase [Lampropedia puyangensis]